MKNTSVIVQAYEYPIDVLSRAVGRYNAAHINQLKLTEDGKIMELRNPFCIKNNYEEKRLEKYLLLVL